MTGSLQELQLRVFVDLEVKSTEHFPKIQKYILTIKGLSGGASGGVMVSKLD